VGEHGGPGRRGVDPVACNVFFRPYKSCPVPHGRAQHRHHCVGCHRAVMWILPSFLWRSVALIWQPRTTPGRLCCKGHCGTVKWVLPGPIWRRTAPMWQPRITPGGLHSFFFFGFHLGLRCTWWRRTIMWILPKSSKSMLPMPGPMP